jgi:hypothetical protein
MLRQEGGKERADHMRALPCLRWTTPVTLPARPGPRAARAFHFRVDLARLTASLRDPTVGAPSSSLLLEKLPELDPKSLRNVHGVDRARPDQGNRVATAAGLFLAAVACRPIHCLYCY